MPASTTPVDRPVLPSRLPAGTPVGRHVIDGWHRDGGMAVLYRGHHVATGAKVAIKVIAQRYATDPELVARFQREGEVMGRLSGVAGVVSVHDVGVLLDDRRYLVMEWIDGEDLEDLLDHQRNRDVLLEIPRACRIARDIARGIAAAHARQVVHRDLKPSNVMLDHRDGVERAKVVDFGVSADLGARARGEELTRTGATLGTSGYMAPEQALGISADPAFDVWPIGVLLYELLTLSRLPPGLERMPDLRERRPDVPDALVNVVRACLAVDLQSRPTAAEVAARLDAVLGQLAIAGLGEVQKDDRPGDTAGSIDDEDVVQPLVRRGDVAALGLAPPPRITPVRVRAMPADAAPKPRRERPESRRGWMVGVVAAIGIAVAIAMWPPQEEVVVEPHVVAASVQESAPRAKKAAPVEKAERAVEIDPPIVEEAEPPIEPEPESEPVLDEKPKRPVKAVAEPSSPAHASSRCVAVRDEAESAKASRNWNGVLAKTRDASCWASPSERALLRVTAFAELERWDECIRTGSGSSDPKVANRTKFCRSQREGG